MIPLPPCCTPSPEATPAERAYCAYNAAGDPETANLAAPWSALPENVRAKWEAAVGEVASFDEPLTAAAAEIAAQTGATEIEVGVLCGGTFIAVGSIEFDAKPDDDQLPLFGRAPVAAEA